MRKTIGLLLRLSVSGGIIWYILHQPDTSLSRIAKSIESIHLYWLLVILLTYKVVILIAALRWTILAKAQGFPLSFKRALYLNYIGFFFNNFMLSLTGGDVVKAYYVAKESTRRAEAVTTVFVDRIVGLSTLIFIGAVAASFHLHDPQMRTAAGLILSVLALVIIVPLIIFNKPLMKRIPFLLVLVNRFPLIGKLRRVYDAFYSYRSHKMAVLKAIGLSVIIWVLLITINYEIALGMGIRIPARYFFLLIPVINVISSIPVTVSGWGLREKVYKDFFGLVGMDGASAVSISILYALTLLIWSLVGGILYVIGAFTREEKVIGAGVQLQENSGG